MAGQHHRAGRAPRLGAPELVGGGILSVLPLGLFPFTPEQSLGHFGAHVVYAVAQIPLVLVAVIAIRMGRRPAASEDPG